MARELDRRPLPRLVAADEVSYGRPAMYHRAEIELAEDRAHQAETGRRRAWVFAWVLIIVCAAQAAAIAIMLPLKDVVPYTILVDRQTGYVETVRGITTGGDLREDEALVHSMLAQYVLQRETFDPADFQSRYERVALWSADEARASYLALYKPGAPGSMLADVRAGTIIAVSVKQIEILGRESARVRFSLTQRTPDAGATESEWVALVGYRFTGEPMRMADRLINPLGFQVTAYRRDAEGAPPVAQRGSGVDLAAETFPPVQSGDVQPSPQPESVPLSPPSGARASPRQEVPSAAKQKTGERSATPTSTSQLRGRQVMGPAE